MSKRILPLIPSGLAVEQIVSSANQITIVTALRATSAACPGCHGTSSRIHGVYRRRLRDLPFQGRPAALLVRVRRFCCANPCCPYQTFAEPLGSIAARSAGRSARLAEVQCQLGLALGGEAGARLAGRLTMPASPNTLLRLVQRARTPEPAAPRVLAVDDWAWRRGQTYGSILVDLERNRVVDLLPDRETGTLSAWLRRHDGVEIVARDRAGAYADAVRQGAPDAMQVADRWHLLRNLGDALRGGVDRHRGAVHHAARAVSEQTTTPTVHVLPPATREELLRADRRHRRQLRHEEMARLHRQDLTHHEIGRAVGASLPTVYRWLKANGPPSHNKPEQPRNIGPHEAYLARRWAEGCRNGARLWRELHAQGYRGGLRSVVRWATRRRREESAGAAEAPRRTMTWPTPSSRRCARLISTSRHQIDAKEQAFVDHLASAAPDLIRAGRLAIAFAKFLRKRRPDIASAKATLIGWIETARRGLLNSFARGLERDKDAVAAAMATPWTTSHAEGQITRLKAIKRSMYGRAGFHLLRQRVLLTA
ncbi:ISL3 family transposase [Falsiroseomonas sp. HC035]|uniref:ISL3 family transposase n=1 Tax=Falsiroseomonas sp. HC035 TaxID=3390999 RepID=UPI003D322731